MLNRKRAIKSNTRDLRVKKVGFDAVKKFEEILLRTGKQDEVEAFMIILDLLDNELPALKAGEAIPEYVMKWRSEQGFDEVGLAKIEE